MKLYPIIFLLLLLGCRNNTGTRGGSLPPFDLLLPDSLTHINTGEIKSGRPIALLYFSPDCEHCQQETKSIIEHMDSLRDVNFYFITNDSIQRIKVFSAVYQLQKYPNITLGWDNQFLFLRHFKGAVPPYMVLYDRNLQQLGIFSGQTEANKIIGIINRL
jgi:thiol-disulfide isomerase/thioredoxin